MLLALVLALGYPALDREWAGNHDGPDDEPPAPAPAVLLRARAPAVHQQQAASRSTSWTAIAAPPLNVHHACGFAVGGLGFMTSGTTQGGYTAAQYSHAGAHLCLAAQRSRVRTRQPSFWPSFWSSTKFSPPSSQVQSHHQQLERAPPF